MSDQDKTYADAVRIAAAKLEDAIRHAQNTGLHVEIDLTDDLYSLGFNEPQIQVTAKVWRPV